MSSVRIVVLGLGPAARNLHLPAIQRLRDVEVVAAADPDRGTHFSGAPFPQTTDWREALATPADGVLVATPPATHAELALTALRSGRHVYLEKPMATSTSDANKIAAAASTRGLVVQMGFAYRMHPLWTRIKRMRSSGRMDGPLTCRAHFSSPREGFGWSGPIVDLACHHVDLLSWVLGTEPSTVLGDIDGGLDVHWPDGSRLVGHYETGPDHDRMTIEARRGHVVIDRLAAVRLTGTLGLLGRAAVPDVGLAIAKRIDRSWERSFERALRAFASQVRHGRAAADDRIAGPSAGLGATRFAEATLRSVQEGDRAAVAGADRR